MHVALSEEAVEYGRVARAAFESAGGDRLAELAAADAGQVDELVGKVLTELGAHELDPAGSPDELEAAATLCRAAGWWSLTHPPSVLVAVLRAGARRTATRTEPLGDAVDPVGLVLGGWTLLGMLDRAVDLTRQYVLEREQFGQPLARFQGVQFQLTDAEVERLGVEELATYALGSVHARPDDALADALALRLAALDAAEIVFRVAHQLHGAIGFCDETTLSWLSRASQSLRRQPLGRSATLDLLTRHVGGRGLTGLFDELAPTGEPS